MSLKRGSCYNNRRKDNTRFADRKPTNRVEKDQCRFCYICCHFQADCRKFKKAQAAVLRKPDEKDDLEEE